MKIIQSYDSDSTVVGMPYIMKDDQTKPHFLMRQGKVSYNDLSGKYLQLLEGHINKSQKIKSSLIELNKVSTKEDKKLHIYILYLHCFLWYIEEIFSLKT